MGTKIDLLPLIGTDTFVCVEVNYWFICLLKSPCDTEYHMFKCISSWEWNHELVKGLCQWINLWAYHLCDLFTHMNLRVNSCAFPNMASDHVTSWIGFTFSLVIIPLEKHHILPCHFHAWKLEFVLLIDECWVLYNIKLPNANKEFVNKMISLVIKLNFIYSLGLMYWTIFLLFICIWRSIVLAYKSDMLTRL